MFHTSNQSRIGSADKAGSKPYAWNESNSVTYQRKSNQGERKGVKNLIFIKQTIEKTFGVFSQDIMIVTYSLGYIAG